MQPAAILNILVTAQTGPATKGLMRVNAQLGATEARANKAVGAFKTLAKGAALGATGAGVAATKLAVDFDRSMRNVNSIAQLNEKQFQNLRKRVLDLAGPTAQAPKTLADGLYSIVSSGFKANDAMKILRAGAVAASAGLTDTATATKSVTAVLNAYHKPATDARKVSDTLFQTVNLGVLSFEDLAQSIGDTLPFAAQVGVNLKGVGAAITTMTRQGLDAPETMTRIRNVIVALLKPSNALHDVFGKLGVAGGPELIKKMGGGRVGLQRALEAIVNTTGSTKDLQKAFQDLGVSGFDQLKRKTGSAGAANAALAKTLTANQSEVAKLFPNIRALGGALALTGQNTRGAEKDLAGFADTSGATSKVFREQSKSVSLQFQRLSAQVKAVAISFASKLLPELSKVIKMLSDPDLTPQEKLDRLGKMFSNAVAKAGPAVAKATAVLGLVAVRAFFDAFRKSPLWFKLITAAFVINRLGGFDSLKRSGVKAGAAFAGGMAVGVAPGMARMQKEMAAAAAGANVGQVAAQSRAGRMVFGQTSRRAVRGRVFRSGEPISQLGARQYGLAGVAGGFAAQAKKIAPQVRAVGANVLGAALLAGVADAATRQGIKGFGDKFQQAASTATFGLIPAPRTVDERLAKITDKIRKWHGGLLSLTGSDNSLIRMKDLNDFTSRQRKMLSGLANLRNAATDVFGRHFKLSARMEINPERTAKRIARIGFAFSELEHGGVYSVRRLRDATRRNFEDIAAAMGVHSKQGRQALAHNFDLGLQTIRRFRKNGVLDTKGAMQEVFRLLKSQSGAGKESLKRNFAEARDFIARTMRNSEGITRQGMRAIRQIFAQELKLYGLSKESIRFRLQGKEQSGKTIGAPLVGKQRGGFINQGAPVGDSVHALLERGEGVINRNAVKAMGGPAAINAINSSVPRFQAGGVAGMVGAANRLDAAHFPYLWGGGHQASPAPFGPMDCSGAVSYVLQHGGVQIPTMVSGALASAGKPGPGRVTVFANPTHTFMRIGNRFFGTSGSNPGGGAGWFPDPGSAYRARFAQRHFVGTGGIGVIPRLTVVGPDSPLRSATQGAVSGVRTAANRRLQAMLTTPIGAGDVGDPGPQKKKVSGSGRTRAHGFQRGGVAGFPKTPINVAADAGRRKARLKVSDLINMVAIAGRESHWNPRAQNLNASTGDHSIGLWQINQLAHHGRFGTDRQLMIPDVNATAMGSLFHAAGLQPWHSMSGATQFLGQAKAAVTAVAGGGAVTRKKPKHHRAVLRALGDPGNISFLGPTAKQLRAQIAALARSATIAGDMADRASQLEAPVNGRDQTGWLNQQLSFLFQERNKLVDLEQFIERHRNAYMKAVADAKKRLAKMADAIRKAAATRRSLVGQVARERKRKPPNKHKIGQFQDRIKRIDRDQANRVAVRKELLGAIPGWDKKAKSLTGSRGGVLESLDTIQGPGSPLTRLATLPKVGVLGGDIFNVQIALRDAANKITDNSTATTDDSGSADLLRELLRQANLRTAVSEAQFRTLRNFDATSGAPFLGAFAKGGVALVGERGPELAHLPSGTRVHSADDTQRMLQPQIVVNGDIVNVPRGKQPVEMRYGRGFDRAVGRSRVNRRLEPLPGRGGGGL